MKILYNFGIFLYSILIRFFSLFNEKAKLRTLGLKNIFQKIESKIDKSEKKIWIHCASLGEFEQGRPIIEKIKAEKPEYKIILTFFSPSGYEVRKNYDLADYIYYLPNDTPKNAKKFIELTKPEIVIFVKYEFWYNFINQAYKKDIPIYLVSGIFRESQAFFKRYGKFFVEILRKFNMLYLQDENSAKLLQKINILNTKVTGDTRFDRVIQIAEGRKEYEIIEKFTKNKTVFIAGSSWKPDEEIIFEYLNSGIKDLKIIIAPHEIQDKNIERIIKLYKGKSIKYSEANLDNINDYNLLIINNIGMLSSIYAYADIAYIGGGFGVGIHNVLEAAVYGVPVIFGKNYKRFNEAVNLLKEGGGFSINEANDFKNIMNKLISDKDFRQKTSEISRNYVYSQKGSVEIIFNEIF